MIEFRPYQKQAIHNVIASLTQFRKVIMVSPTGSGKTVMAGGILDRFLSKDMGQAMVLLHGQELLHQWAESMYGMFKIESGIIQGNTPRQPSLPLQIASVQTAIRRQKVPNIGLIIVDECHRSAANSYVKLIAKYPEAYIVGVTATPIRSDDKGMGDYYDYMVVGTTKMDLIEQGFLVPFRVKISPMNPEMLRGIRMIGGDYDEKALGEMMQDDSIMADAFNMWNKYASDRQTIAFCATVAHAQAVAEMFKEKGIDAAYVCGETPKTERNQIISDFRKGRITHLSNVGVLTEGFDVKQVACVQLLRATKSYALYSQMVGRGMRPYPGKEDCLLLDHANNMIEHGNPNTEPKWSLYKTKVKEDDRVVAVRKKDDQGKEEVVMAYQSELPLFTEEFELVDVDLRFRKELVDRNIEWAEQRGYKQSAAWYNFQEGLSRQKDMPTISELHYFKDLLGYDGAWVKYKAKELGIKIA